MTQAFDDSGPWYLDTNIFIYAIERAPSENRGVTALYRRLDSGGLKAVTSALTLAEVLVHPIRDGNHPLIAIYKSRIRTEGTLCVVPVSRRVLIESARLRAVTPSLKLPDAIHAATALLTGCTSFITSDRRFLGVKGLSVSLLTAEV